MNGPDTSASFLHFDLETVRAVAQLLHESALGEIEIETTGDEKPAARLLLRRALSTPHVFAPVAVTDQSASLNVSPESDAPAEASTPAPGVPVSASAVGVFRFAPKGEIKQGDEVKLNQVIGVVESLRVPNEIVSPVAGRVISVLAQDGQGVEYGQVLFVIEEAS